MIVFPLVIAEVADKEPPPWTFVLLTIGCVVVALPMIKSKWAAVVAIPVALAASIFSAAFIWEEVGDPYVGPGIIRELGYPYVVSVYASAIIPPVLVAALLLQQRKKVPNNSPEPTPGSVTPAASAPAAPPPSAAQL